MSNKNGKKYLRDIVFQNFAQLNYVKGITPKEIYEKRADHPEFWRDWLISYNKKAEYLESDLGRTYAIKSLAAIQKCARTRNCLKQFFVEQAIQKNKIQDVNNQIIFEDVKQELITDGGKEVSVKTTKTITSKKIDKIEFASPTSISTFQNVLDSQKVSSQWFNDYRKSIEASMKGEVYNGKFQFNQMEVAGKYKIMVLELVDRCKNDIMTGGIDEVRLAEARLKSCEKMLLLLEGVIRTEMAPLNAMKVMHETGFIRQREINMATANDSMLISTGNIVLNDEKEVHDKKELRIQLKEQGFGRINDLFLEQLKDAGALEKIDDEIKEIESDIENPKIDEEL